MRNARRYFLLGGASALGTIGMVHAPARAAQWEFKLGDTEPADHPKNQRLTQWANAIRTETGGRMNVTIYPAASLGSATSMLAQVRQGAIQFFSNLSSIFTSVVPVTAIDSVGFTFGSSRDAWAAMDGPLGAYVRKEFTAHGLYAFEKMWDIGMRQVTTSSRAVRTAPDLAGLKLRTPPAKIEVDLFSTLGASPTPLDSSEAYTAMQTHLVDGQESPASTVVTERLYEVQKYLSLTNHVWAGHWIVANLDVWNGLPADVRGTIERNTTKYVQLERSDMTTLNNNSIEACRTHGLTVNTADAASMRAKLGPYYARWKTELGSGAWDLLEAKVGKLS